MKSSWSQATGKRRITPRKVTLWFLEADLSEPPCWDEPGLQEKGDRTWLMSKENNENKSKPRAWPSSLHRLGGLLFFSLCDLAQALYLLQDSVFSPVKWEQELSPLQGVLASMVRGACKAHITVPGTQQMSHTRQPSLLLLIKEIRGWVFLSKWKSLFLFFFP